MRCIERTGGVVYSTLLVRTNSANGLAPSLPVLQISQTLWQSFESIVDLCKYGWLDDLLFKHFQESIPSFWNFVEFVFGVGSPEDAHHGGLFEENQIGGHRLNFTCSKAYHYDSTVPRDAFEGGYDETHRVVDYVGAASVGQF